MIRHTTKVAALELHVTPDRIRQMIAAGTLKARKRGGNGRTAGDWLITQTEIERVRDRKPGRPKKV